MTVIERAENGYVKGRDKNGNTFYRDSQGHPVSQQAYAASKGREKYEPELDPDTGKIVGNRKREDAGGGGVGGRDIPVRITAHKGYTSGGPGGGMEVHATTDRIVRVPRGLSGADIDNYISDNVDMPSEILTRFSKINSLVTNRNGWPNESTENMAVERIDMDEMERLNEVSDAVMFGDYKEQWYSLSDNPTPEMPLDRRGNPRWKK